MLQWGLSIGLANSATCWAGQRVDPIAFRPQLCTPPEADGCVHYRHGLVDLGEICRVDGHATPHADVRLQRSAGGRCSPFA